MRALGADLAGQLAAGDLIVLSGELGAGKTTFTQGLGQGLGVRGDVTSPTFVIARVHPSLGNGPALVHADAYRLGGIHELDDLDLDTSLDDAVTVVEWGEGVAEGLSESRLELRIIRALAHVDEQAELDPRRVLMTPIGPRWHDLQLPDSLRPPLAEKVDETLLLDFRACAEDELEGVDAAIPLRLSLMTARHGGRVLMVRNLRSGEWELPGGPIAVGETPRRAAERRLVEETGVRAGAVAFVGMATVQLGHARDIEFIALFRSTLDDDATAHAGTAGREVTWWDPTASLAGLSPIDAHLAELSVAGPA
jgi:tRNA threonylcarbamoyl adenosine modification protein YjeE